MVRKCAFLSHSVADKLAYYLDLIMPTYHGLDRSSSLVEAGHGGSIV